MFICRAFKNGVWIPGQLEFGRSTCLVSSFGSVSSHSKYQVLENTADAAKLNWVKLSKFDQIPVGAVYGSEDALIARRKINSDSEKGRQHYVGKIRQQGFSLILTVIDEVRNFRKVVH